MVVTAFKILPFEGLMLLLLGSEELPSMEKKKKGFLHFLKEIDNHQIQSCQIKCVSWYQTASTWGRPNVAVYDGSK